MDNPFELVVARRRRNLQEASVQPDLPTLEVDGFEYVMERDDRVRAPDLPLRPDEWGPGTGFDVSGITTSRFPVTTKPLPERLREGNDAPEVLFREAIRACLERGLDPDKMLEIWELEIVGSVMDS